MGWGGLGKEEQEQGQGREGLRMSKGCALILSAKWRLVRGLVPISKDRLCIAQVRTVTRIKNFSLVPVC